MCYKIIECITLWDITSFILGILLSALTSIIIIRFFRPNMCIGIPKLDKKSLKFSVKNLNKKYAVTNLRIEAAAVLNDQTYHLKFDRYDFLMLAKLDNKTVETPYERTFHAIDIDEYTKDIALNCQNLEELLNLLKNEKAYLRVRLHANHEFTGFGKAFPAKFKLNKNMEFEPYESNNIWTK